MEEKTKKKMVVEEVKEVDKAEEKSSLLPEPSEETSVAEEEKLSSHSENKNNLIWILLPVFVVIASLLGGVIGYQIGLKKAFPAQSPQPSSVSEAVVSPEPSPSGVNLKEFEISIKNGSGIAGEANKAKDLLENKGFSVTSTGNAGSYDYKKTMIRAKEKINPEFIRVLKETLNTNYLSEVGDNLKDSDNNQVLIIVGSEKAKASVAD